MPHSRRCLFASGAGVVADVPAVVGVVAVVVRAVVGATVLGVSVGADAVLGVGVGADVLPAVGPVDRAVAVVGVGADAVLGVVVGAVLEAVVGAGAVVRAGSCGCRSLPNVGEPEMTNLARRTRTHKGVGLLRTGAWTSSSSSASSWRSSSSVSSWSASSISRRTLPRGLGRAMVGFFVV